MEDKHRTDDDYENDGIGLSDEDLSELGSKFVIPIKSRIIKVGSSSAVTIPNKVLEHLDFTLGDYVGVILLPRDPTDEELKRDKKKKGKRTTKK